MRATHSGSRGGEPGGGAKAMAESITYADLRFVKAPLKHIPCRLEEDPDADEDGDLTYENVQVPPVSSGLSSLPSSGPGDKAGTRPQQPTAAGSPVTSSAAGSRFPCPAVHAQYFLIGLLLTSLLLAVAAICLGVRYLQVSQQLQLMNGVLETTNSSLREQLLHMTSELGKREELLLESKKEVAQRQQSLQETQEACQATGKQLETCQSVKEETESSLHREEERARNLEQRLSRMQEIKKCIFCHSSGDCCPVGWILNKNQCFHISLTKRTHERSKNYCQSLSSDLATYSGRTYSSTYSSTSNWPSLEGLPGSHWIDYKYSEHYQYSKDTGRCFSLVHSQWSSYPQKKDCTDELPCVCQRAAFKFPEGDGFLH